MRLYGDTHVASRVITLKSSDIIFTKVVLIRIMGTIGDSLGDRREGVDELRNGRSLAHEKLRAALSK